MIKEYIDGQSIVKDMLTSSYHKNRLTHAYIFNGPLGVGKKEMALYMASLMYCKEPNVCYECDNCKQIFSLKHPNIYEIYPNNNIISVSQIEALQDEFFKTSLVSGPRFYIIHDASLMNVYAQNKLLKFIEEPINKNTYGILLTTDYSNLLPTIISRCGVINFKHMDKVSLFNKLIESNFSKDKADIIKELVNNLEDANKIYNDQSYMNIIDISKSYLSIKHDTERALYFLKNNDILIDIDNMKKYLDILILLFEDLLLDSPIRFKTLETLFKNYKKNHNINIIKKNLELLLLSRKMVDARVNTKNIALNLFANLK